MSGPFGAIDTAGTGMRVQRAWLDAIAHNMSNLNTVRPTSGDAFRAHFVVARERAQGADVGGIVLGSREGRVVYEPDHPLADERGLVRYPDIDLGDQMVYLLAAQRSYQANVAVVERVRDAYLQALSIGR